MDNSKKYLPLFHPLVQKWFTENIGDPTDIQNKSWPQIADNKHVLITAPTGSGKTLTAFLWAVNCFLTKKMDTGQTGVLYISPLKALNNDIQRNLLKPIAELKETFNTHNESFPDISVLTRSGDTPQSDRRKMLRHPPEILITTPESLNLLLSSSGGKSILTKISTVILDEIHGVIGSKRGVHLITAVERLTLLSGEFQRIALSATIRPLETVANFIGGYAITGNLKHPVYKKRKITIIRSDIEKQYHVTVRSVKKKEDMTVQESIWTPLVKEFKKKLHRTNPPCFLQITENCVKISPAW